jgi:Fe-S oxidoreductase
MLTLAKRFLRQILDGMQEQIIAGVPVVVLEPNCAAVFRDELRNLLPHDEDATRLSRQTYLLSEFLQHTARDRGSRSRPASGRCCRRCDRRTATRS